MSFQLRYIEENWKTMAKGAALGGLGYMLADHFSDNVHDFNQDMHDTASKGAGNYWNSWMDKGQHLFDNLKVNNGIQPGTSYQMTPEEMKNVGIASATASPESVAAPQATTQPNNTQPNWPNTGQELSPTQLQASGQHDLSKLKSVAGISNNTPTVGTANQNNHSNITQAHSGEKIDINSLEKKYGYNNPAQSNQTPVHSTNQQTTVNQNQTQNTTHNNSNGFKSRYSQSDVDRAMNMF